MILSGLALPLLAKVAGKKWDLCLMAIVSRDCSLYSQGDYTDLCRVDMWIVLEKLVHLNSPRRQDNGEGNENNPQMQRIYGGVRYTEAGRIS